MSKKLIYADDARRAILHEEPRLAYCIERIKGVDAVEVVRCKDCIYNKIGSCEYSERVATYYDQNWFCADGERKDNV